MDLQAAYEMVANDLRAQRETYSRRYTLKMNAGDKLSADMALAEHIRITEALTQLAIYKPE